MKGWPTTKRILIVDDDEQGLYMLRVLLEGHGHEVVPAVNGAMALEEARRDPPDIIITDILMPVMDGFTLCRECKRDDNLRQVPFIFYTATYTDAKDEEFALSLGADRFITKPTEPDEFISLLEEVIREAEKEKPPPKELAREHEKELFELYSQRLVNKLEKKMLDLETEIARRKRVEEELRASEERYRELVQSVNSMIIRFDAQGNITFFNEFAQQFFGYSQEEILGRNIVGTIVPDREENRRDLARIIEESADNPEAYETREYRNMRRDGRRAWVAWTSKPILDDSGRVSEILGVGVDITVRKEIQRNLEKLNRLILGLGPDIIDNIEAVLQAGKEILSGQYMQYCRLQKGKLFSVSFPPEVEGLTVTDRPEDHICHVIFSSGSDEPLIIEDFHGAHLEEAHAEIRERGFRSFAGYPVKLGTEVIGCLSLWREEPRKLARNELDTLGTLARIISIEEEKLAREEHLKDLVDIASHELRHPITLMKGYAVSLRELWEKVDEEQRVQMLDAIDYGANRMEKVLRELLDVSRIERGLFRLNRQRSSIEPLIERAVAEMRDRGIQNDIDVSIKGDIGAQNVDPNRLVELLIILIDNAAEFSPSGSEIAIEAKAEDGGILVSVLDRGQGISERDRDRVFERFYQVEEALHHSKPGIGLGLYIAKEIAEAHEGRIWNEPREGGGTVFRFTIPASSR